MYISKSFVDQAGGIARVRARDADGDPELAACLRGQQQTSP